MRRICIGKITTAHGVKGLVKILPQVQDESLLEGNGVFLDRDGTRPAHISLKNRNGKFWLAHIEGINNREDAKELRNTKIWMNRDDLPKTENDEYYIEDLIGLDAIDTDKQPVGKIVAAPDFGAGIMLEIQLQNGEAFFIPFTRNAVPAIDLENGRATIDRNMQII